MKRVTDTQPLRLIPTLPPKPRQLQHSVLVTSGHHPYRPSGNNAWVQAARAWQLAESRLVAK